MPPAVITTLYYLGTLLLAYLLGALPFGFWIVKALMNVDLRQVGSGGTGATNVKRTAGWSWACVTLLLDALKGALAVMLAQHVSTLISDPYEILPVLAAIMAVVGHSKSVFLNFKGGKSVATALGVFMVLSPQVMGISVGLALIIMAVSGMVSVGSIMACVICIGLSFVIETPVSTQVLIALVAVFIIAMHRANIQRIIAGQENRLW